MALKDKNQKEKNWIKNIEKQKELYHIDKVKMNELDKTINTILAEDEMKLSHRNIVLKS